jgi:hypothetical protein
VATGVTRRIGERAKVNGIPASLAPLEGRRRDRRRRSVVVDDISYSGVSFLAGRDHGLLPGSVALITFADVSGPIAITRVERVGDGLRVSGEFTIESSANRAALTRLLAAHDPSRLKAADRDWRPEATPQAGAG